MKKQPVPKMRSIIVSSLLFGLCCAGNSIATPFVLDADVNAPPPKWDWQLQSPVLLNDDPEIEFYDIDMFDNESTGVVGQLKSYGKTIICYVNVGAWEDWRDDKNAFPPSILGNEYDRFPDERWLDIRDVNPAKSTTGTALRDLLEARFDRAQQMGCDAVEPDNMDGFNELAHNPSGFPLTYEDQIYFNLWISGEIRERGMAAGFKNNTLQAMDPRMVEAFDFVVTESCVLFNECNDFTGFLNADKPVFLAEYFLSPEEFCPAAKELRISGIQKRGALGSFRLGCDAYYDSNQDPDPDPEPGPFPPAKNLLVNGDFESGLFQWNPCGEINNLSVSSDASQGEKAAAISNGAGCLYQEVPVNSGETYTLTCEATRPGTLWSIVQLSFLDVQFNNLESEIATITSGGPYSTYTLSGVAPANTVYGLALIYSEDELLLDNCSLVPLTQPEPEPEPPVENRLVNGDFESGLFQWNPCGDINNLTVSNNASQGNQALAITGGAGCVYQEVAVEVGEEHTLVCEATRPGTLWSIVQFSYLDAQYNSLSSQQVNIATGGNYAAYSFAGTAPANTTYALVLIYSEDELLVDNCVFSNQ